MKIIDPAHPFYKPLWRRIAIAVVVALWFAFEVYMGNTMWMVIVGAVLVYSVWVLLIDWKDGESST